MTDKRQNMFRKWFAVQPEWANGWWVVAKDKDGNDSVDASGDGGFEKDEAHLIAAAPELLEALEALIDEAHPMRYNDRKAIARKVIEKARGE